MSKKHTYIIPYYKHNNNILILLAQKKFYSSRDGFIHSNPYQYVLIGGHLEKNYNIKDNIAKEFNEETGHKINMNKLKLLNVNNKNFDIGIYECNENEYNKFKNLKNMNSLYKELNYVFWIDFKNAVNFMKNNNNININIMTNEYLNIFYSNLDTNKTWFLTREILPVISYYKNNNMSNKEVLKKVIFPMMRNRNKKISNQLFNSVSKYIKKNSYYDWFIESLYIFEQNLKSLNDVNNNSKNSKLNRSKKAYIPPHLRNKN